MAKTFLSLPAAKSVRLVPFKKAVVRKQGKDYVLVVSGIKPYLNMHVELVPMIYIMTPDYWAIEVVGKLDGIGLPTTAPYTVGKIITHTIGTKGIAVVGANGTKKIKVP